MMQKLHINYDMNNTVRLFLWDIEAAYKNETVTKADDFSVPASWGQRHTA